LAEIKKLRLDFTIGKALSFFSAGLRIKQEDSDLMCEESGRLSGLKTVEIIFERDVGVEAAYEEWGGYESVVDEAAKRLRMHI
jgi:hypothetical protein